MPRSINAELLAFVYYLASLAGTSPSDPYQLYSASHVLLDPYIYIPGGLSFRPGDATDDRLTYFLPFYPSRAEGTEGKLTHSQAAFDTLLGRTHYSLPSPFISQQVRLAIINCRRDFRAHSRSMPQSH